MAQLSALKNLKLNSSTGTSNVDALFTTATDTVVSAIAKSAVTCMLPQVVGLIKFYLMCPASSVTAERSFSQLHRLKTYLRSTMSQKWLNLLLILSTYTDEVDALDMRMLVNSFISRNDY